MKLKLLKAVLVSAMMSVCSFANAGLITASATIDLDSAISNNVWTGYAHFLDNEVTVANGDTVTINIDFLGDQYLTWSSDGYFNPWLMINDWWDNWNYENPGHTGGFSWSNVSVNFQNLIQGNNFSAGQLAVNGTSSSIHLGPTNSLGNDNILRQFSGVSVTFDTSFNDGDLVRTYDSVGYGVNSPYVLFQGNVDSSVITTDVPEPSTLVIFALGMIALVSRRFKKQS